MDIRKFFYNKHRAYLLTFALLFVIFRVPPLLGNKAERLFLSRIESVLTPKGISFGYENFKFNLPLKVSLSNLTILKSKAESLTLSSAKFDFKLRIPPKVLFEATIFDGKLSCSFEKWPFFGDVSTSCNANSIDLHILPYVNTFNIQGPLSFKFTGPISPTTGLGNLSGEFLSEIDANNLKLPPSIPSFIKIPNLEILSVHGKFNFNGNKITLNETSVASTLGDFAINLETELDSSLQEINSLKALINIRLSPLGIQKIAPWLALATGGKQLSSSGEGVLEVTGSTKGGFKSKLLP